MSAALSSATINPGIIEMQMSSVTAPQHDGGQVAHFIMLLSCCPLLVCEQGSLEGCCVAMYNSCSNSCMSGAARDTHRDWERERETEGGVGDGLCCVTEAHCIYRQACTDIYTRSQRRRRSARFGIQNQMKTVLPRHHLCWFTGIYLALPALLHTHTRSVLKMCCLWEFSGNQWQRFKLKWFDEAVNNSETFNFYRFTLKLHVRFQPVMIWHLFLRS